MNHLSDHGKHVIDAAAIAATVGAFVDILPSIAAVLTIVWTGIRIWETRTVQGILGRSERSNPRQD